jgi:hypothetical protein
LFAQQIRGQGPAANAPLGHRIRRFGRHQIDGWIGRREGKIDSIESALASMASFSQARLFGGPLAAAALGG